MNESKTEKTPNKKIEEQLDEALADSFPASDPVSFVTSQTEEDWAEEPPTPQGPGPGGSEIALDAPPTGKPKEKTTEP